MPPAFAILLDGGFVCRKLGTRRDPVTAAKISGLARSIATLGYFSGMRLHRIYFYDAKPLTSELLTPLAGPRRNLGTTDLAARMNRIHASLPRQPFFALRFGELAHDGWRVRDEVLVKPGPRVEIDHTALQPNIRQKGVDMRIGLDIASLTLKKHVQVIALATADSDFIPAMKFARREGAQLFLFTLGHGVSDGLREHADVVVETMPGHAGPSAQSGVMP